MTMDISDNIHQEPRLSHTGCFFNPVKSNVFLGEA
jgi:hypothetical protein